jgi:hypothetical protein
MVNGLSAPTSSLYSYSKHSIPHALEQLNTLAVRLNKFARFDAVEYSSSVAGESRNPGGIRAGRL